MLAQKSPEELLQQIEAEEAKRTKGRLKIFFGYAAGVGKTYAMLQAAHEAKERHVDVVVGYVEAHDRPQTTALINGLEVLPTLSVGHKGITLTEFDLDGALQREPQLLLVDELAHTNSDVCRHRKRYKDIEELLNAGIDVYTTVNVQHLESLNDIVASITGIVVRERVPDSVFDEADQVRLVDIEPADLIARLNEEKVYHQNQAQLALGHFFSLENLIALRELALRRMADRVNRLSQQARSSSKSDYYTDEHILVCLSSSPSNPRIIRTAARMASSMRCRFTALFVHTSDFEDTSAANKARLEQNTALARQLGATIETLFGNDIAYQIAEFAKYAGISKIVIGRSATRARFDFWHKDFLDTLIDLAANLDIYVIPDRSIQQQQKKHWFNFQPLHAVFSGRDFAKVFLLWFLTTLTVFVLGNIHYGEADVATLYILSVLLAGLFTTRRFYSIVLALANILTFDYFFVYPAYSFFYSNDRYIGTFLIMFIAAFITGTMANKIKQQSDQSARVAYRTRTLLDTNQLLQKANECTEIATVTAQQLSKLLNRTVIYYPNREGLLGEPLVVAAGENPDAVKGCLTQNERAVAQWVLKNNVHAGAGTNTLGNAKCLYLAVRSKAQVYGVVAIAVGSNVDAFTNDIVLSILGECSLALEKEHSNNKRRSADVQAQNEKLRANLLRSISHDLRTPLTAISGNADFLLSSCSELDVKQRRQLYAAIYDDAKWLINLVENILSVTRIDNGSLQFDLQAELIEDVIDEAISHIDPQRLLDHPLVFQRAPQLYLAMMDAHLIMQVIINLIDNALKYTPPQTQLTIADRRAGDAVLVTVADTGAGISDAEKAKIFEMFYTNSKINSDGRRGIGIGLSLCRSIIAAHKGTITVADNQPHGTIFSFTLPLVETDFSK